MPTIPNVTTGTLRTPPVVQSSVIALRTAGKSKRFIAKELGINRATVDNVLAIFQTDTPKHAEIIQSKLIPKALARIEQVLENDTDTARYVLDNTLFRQSPDSQYVIGGDLTQHLTLLPSTPSQPSATATTSTDAARGTEAAAKPPQSDMSLSPHTNFSPAANFSQFSLAELEAEVARRKATLIEAEVVR